MKSLREKIDSVLARRNPDGIPVKESFASDEVGELPKFVRIAMEEVDAKYTNASKEAGAHVRDHLKEVLHDVSFQYQGSVVTDTHIKGASDIDLLVICDKFFSWNRQSVERVVATGDKDFSVYQYNRLVRALETEEYKGNWFDDLSRIRKVGERVLSETYSICDSSKAKSIKITNQNLHRDVDIVVASWYDDVISIANDKDIVYRGIQVFNKSARRREPVDYPFKRAKLLNERSASTQGRLKKMIRLLKTLKAEAEYEIDFSSFDIYALCYAMPLNLYAQVDYLHLVPALDKYFYGQVHDPLLRNRLRSVDGEEIIFSDGNKINAAIDLYSELHDLHCQLKEGGLL